MYSSKLEFLLQALVRVSHFNPCRIFAAKAGAYKSKALVGILSNGEFLALSGNITLGQKCLTVTNILAYYST